MSLFDSLFPSSPKQCDNFLINTTSFLLNQKGEKKLIQLRRPAFNKPYDIRKLLKRKAKF